MLESKPGRLTEGHAACIAEFKKMSDDVDLCKTENIIQPGCPITCNESTRFVLDFLNDDGSFVAKEKLVRLHNFARNFFDPLILLTLAFRIRYLKLKLGHRTDWCDTVAVHKPPAFGRTDPEFQNYCTEDCNCYREILYFWNMMPMVYKKTVVKCIEQRRSMLSAIRSSRTTLLRWKMNYLAIAAGCDTPIVEAVHNASLQQYEAHDAHRSNREKIEKSD